MVKTMKTSSLISFSLLLPLFFQTAITGSAEDGTEATEENKSDEERVSSASPAYIPPSSPAVFIQPGGEVQFTKDQSPGKEAQDS